MKAMSIAVALIAAACVCAGMIDTNEYTTKEYKTVAGAGECLDDIAGRYYKYDDRKIVWDEFRTEVWSANKERLHKGSLWEGDEVVVVVKKKISK